MFLYDFLLIGEPFDSLSPRFSASREQELSDAAPTFGGTGQVWLSRTRERNDALVRDVSWVWAEQGDGAPVEGDLQLAPLREGRSHLSVSAMWDSTKIEAAPSVERLRMKREAELRLRRFLAAVAESLLSSG